MAGKYIKAIETAVHKLVGFTPRSVERAINDLDALCSPAGPFDAVIENSLALEKHRDGGGILSGSSQSSCSS